MKNKKTVISLSLWERAGVRVGEAISDLIKHVCVKKKRKMMTPFAPASRQHTVLRIIYRLILLTVFCLPIVATAIDQANTYFREKQWEPAVSAYRQVLPDLSGDAAADTLTRLGRALENLDRPGEAAREYRRVETIEGVSGLSIYDARMRLGHLLLSQSDAGEAEKVFGETIPRIRDIAGSTAGIGWAREERAASLAAHSRALIHEDSGFWIAPYTTFVTDTSAHVYWVSRGEQPAGDVMVGSDQQQILVEAERRELRHAPGFFIHSARVKDLRPATRYSYQVRIGEAERSGSFKTAPIPGEPAPVRFTVYGDTQNRPDFHIQVSDSMAPEKPDFVLHTGDMVGPGSEWWAWKIEFFDPAASWLRHSPVYPSVGNHDGHMFYDPLFRGDNELYHSFTYGNIEIFIVASYRGGSVGSSNRDAQLAWLEQALKNSTADWKIAVTHYPMISAGTAHWVNWGQDDFHPLFEQYGMDFVLTGHTHVYRRFLPIVTGDGQAVFHITSGGGASVGGDFGHAGRGEPFAPNPLTPVAVHALHYLVFDVEGNRLTMEARLRDGTILDRLELEKEDGRYDATILADALDFQTARNKVRAYTALQADPGRRHNRQAPARFTARDDTGQRFNLQIENRLPEQVGAVRFEPATDSAWTFDPVIFRGNEPIRFDVTAPEPLGSPRDLPLDVRISLVSERNLVAETFRITVSRD